MSYVTSILNSHTSLLLRCKQKHHTLGVTVPLINAIGCILSLALCSVTATLISVNSMTRMVGLPNGMQMVANDTKLIVSCVLHGE